MHLRFLNPLPPGIKEIMQRFSKVIAVETNFSDDPDDEMIDDSNRRYTSMAILLRSRYLVDVDCWSEVRGRPIRPSTLRKVLLAKLEG
jgi:2-oxoglutarate ferredoxin oxidoreductase subunit alpha